MPNRSAEGTIGNPDRHRARPVKTLRTSFRGHRNAVSFCKLADKKGDSGVEPEPVIPFWEDQLIFVVVVVQACAVDSKIIGEDGDVFDVLQWYIQATAVVEHGFEYFSPFFLSYYDVRMNDELVAIHHTYPYLSRIENGRCNLLYHFLHVEFRTTLTHEGNLGHFPLA